MPRSRNPYAWVGCLLAILLFFTFNFAFRLGGGEDAVFWVPVVFGSFLLICGIAGYLIWRKESEIERMREQQTEQWQGDMLERKTNESLGASLGHSDNSPAYPEDSPGHPAKPPANSENSPDYL
jgi:hypothetical protein